jgi:hypothetical protein
MSVKAGQAHDDVAWDEAGSPVELLQTKHHVGISTGLGDKDADMWKTLLVWMNTAHPTDPQGPALILVTTSVARTGTAAHALRRDVRDTPTAVMRLTDAARSSDSQSTKKARDRFLALTDAERQIFIARVVVADGAPSADDLDEKLARILWHALPDSHQDLFMSMVWRWWAAVALDMLRGRRARMSAGEAHAAISHVRDQFSEDNLRRPVCQDNASRDSTGRCVPASLSGRAHVCRVRRLGCGSQDYRLPLWHLPAPLLP